MHIKIREKLTPDDILAWSAEIFSSFGVPRKNPLKLKYCISIFNCLRRMASRYNQPVKEEIDKV